MIQKVNSARCITPQVHSNVTFQGKKSLENGKDSFFKTAKDAKQKMNELHDMKDIPTKEGSLYDKFKKTVNKLHDTGKL